MSNKVKEANRIFVLVIIGSILGMSCFGPIIQKPAHAEAVYVILPPSTPVESVPVGSVVIDAIACPSGYLEANGASISRATYSALFTRYGVTYGTGNGSTTFNIPDYRGYFPRGRSAGSGRDPDVGARGARPDGVTGDAVGTIQGDMIKSHDHVTGRYAGTGFMNGSYGPAMEAPHVGVTSPTGGNETRPINISVLYCIKY